jgi:eukaryotic-like serine/threonine-protein kinase
VASPPGNLLAGRYKVLKRLGSGGMATVLLAEDERLGRQVAVKRMHAESPEETAKRFRREAQLGASLNHPNIVSVFDIETDDENVLIVMEYVPGGTLKDALARGPLPRDVALKILRGVASALDYAHEHDIVHRDIKPANILLDANGRAKLADLGIATAAEVTRVTQTGSVLGTASYMAPERLDGQPGGKAVDVYGLAVVAYEALTGHKARQGRSAVEIAAMVMSEPPPDLRTHVPDAPEEAARVLERGMARDPAERQDSAGELVDELCRAFETVAEPEREPEPTTPLPPDPVTPPEPQRATAPAAVAATPPAQRPAYTPQRSERRWLGPVLAAAALLVVAAIAIALIAGGGDDEGGSNGGSSTSADRSTTEQQQSTSGDESTQQQATPPASAGADPEQTVEDFYTRAADDDFDGAWELAGPGVREQLGGFDSFKGTLGTLEKIEFPVLRTSVQNGDKATVELQSVATHTDRTDRCNGTAELAGGDGNWKIDHLNVDCSSGTGGGTNPPQATPGKGPAGGRPVPPGQQKKQKGPKKEK